MSTPTHVVWADDQPELLVEVQARLATRGFAITTVDNGFEAAALVEKTFPRLLVVDIRMPPGSDGGLWLVKHVRTVLRSTVTTIVLSGKGTRLEVAQALQLGANHFVEKDAATDAIENEITRFLDEFRDEQHDRAVGETREELDKFEKVARKFVLELFEAEFGPKAYSRLVDDLRALVPEEQWTEIEPKLVDSNRVLEHTYLSNLSPLLLGKWNRLSTPFAKVGLQRGEFSQRFERAVSIRNRLSHANHVPLMELLRTRVLIYDVSRAFTLWESQRNTTAR